MADLDPGERLWLVESLADLIESRGAARFLDAPLVEPTPAFFPDRWTADAASVRALALRLLGHAGLGLDARVEVFDDGGTDEMLALSMFGQQTQHAGTAAWFAGIDRGVCLFGAEARTLTDAVGVVGAMAHEIAHAYRRHHRLEVGNADVEERLTDLTTIYLGFGILTANAAYRYRAESKWEGASQQSSYRHAQTGYLGREALSFLLAVQVVARGEDPSEQRRIARLLETNQAAAFRDACAAIDRAALGPLLGDVALPPPKPPPRRRDWRGTARNAAMIALGLLAVAAAAFVLDALVG